jgi:hypothetical protein
VSESDLAVLLKTMRPELMPGQCVFVTLPDGEDPGVEQLATVREAEGLSVVLARENADRLGLDYDFVAGWITLRVESALEAVGLTAAVSTCLTRRGISCNVVAGFHHDHLLVPVDSAEEALKALERLSASGPD